MAMVETGKQEAMEILQVRDELGLDQVKKSGASETLESNIYFVQDN